MLSTINCNFNVTKQLTEILSSLDRKLQLQMYTRKKHADIIVVISQKLYFANNIDCHLPHKITTLVVHACQDNK